MAQSYFKNFNVINYANTPALDLTERIVQVKSQQYNPYIFYPLSVADGIRPDVIANKQWGDPYASWILYLTNGIIDPYYDFYLNQETFGQFITSKYGSMQAAQQLILYWQTDWSNAPSISIAGYAALSADQMKYYQPNYMNSPTVINYVRSQQALTTTTNYILNLQISGNTVSFANSEPLQISYVPGSNGTAQYLTGNSTHIIVQHGQFDAFPAPANPNTSVVIANTSYIYGTKSGANAVITGCTFVSNNINIDELVYWSPVNAYDFEVAKNAGNRIINVMQQKYVPAFVNRTANLLSQVVK